MAPGKEKQKVNTAEETSKPRNAGGATNVDPQDDSRDKCGTCELVVGDEDKAMGCEICERWYHIQCEHLPESVYEFMVNDEAGEQLNWHCSYCKRGCMKVYKYMKNIAAGQMEVSTRQTALEVELKELKEYVTHEVSVNKDMETRLGAVEALLVDKNEKVEKLWKVEGEFKGKIQAMIEQETKEYFKRPELVKQAIDPAVKKAIGSSNDLNAVVQTKVHEAMGQAHGVHQDKRKEIRQYIADIRQEEERQNNLIIHNLVEQQENEDVTKTSDVKNFLDIAKICGANISEEDILNCQRIGKKNLEEGKTRPVLIKLSTSEKKRRLFLRLGNWRKYQEENRGPEDIAANKPFINIAHDMTQGQRKERKSLLEEAKNLNTHLPAETHVKWLVRGPPWKMSLQKVTQVTQDHQELSQP